ncbi:MAG: hypothetical protein K0Q58_338 [Microbacterium sp.]|jgi:hypothetical protein|nr:hypothetical protein [Microbacterium sp.]
MSDAHEETRDPEAAFAPQRGDERAPFSLPTVAASAAILRDLQRDLTAAREASQDPAVRAAFDAVLDGRAPLASLLREGVLPAPAALDLDDAVSDFLRDETKENR